MPKYKFTRQDIIRPNEFEKIYQDCPEKYRPFLFLIYKTGARISELLTLTKSDLTIDQDIILVRLPTLKKKQNSPIIEKRTIPIRPNADFVNFLNQAKDQDKLFSFSRWSFWRTLKKIDSSLSPHIFRHSRLTLLAEKGASEQVLKAWTGWSDTRPSKNYMHYNKELIKAFAD